MTTEQTTSPVPSLKLGDGHQIPQLGFGVFQVPEEDTAEVVTHALRTGYRSIDTAAAYGNEAGVGKAVSASELERGQVFITTKLWNDAHSRERATLCELRSGDHLRSIGVSNFTVEHLEQIIDATGVVPAVNQIELHPQFQQRELREFHRARGIVTEAWSPLGQGTILGDATIEEIGAAHDRTPAQVVLRWHLQLGNVVIPKSVTPSRIEENFRLFDFELSEKEMRALEGLDDGKRIGPDPRSFG
jgi:2,5-diketo-D-gluconate reductase A